MAGALALLAMGGHDVGDAEQDQAASCWVEIGAEGTQEAKTAVLDTAVIQVRTGAGEELMSHSESWQRGRSQG